MSHCQRLDEKDFKIIKKYTNLKINKLCTRIESSQSCSIPGPRGIKGEKGALGEKGQKGQAGVDGQGINFFDDDRIISECGRQANILIPLPSANNDIVLLSTGGALERTIPDGTVAGGNCRGQYAVDFQVLRNDPSQVASGEFSFIGNGFNNTASGDLSFIGSGFDNIASGFRSFIGSGRTNMANGNGSFIGTGGNTADGNGSFIGSGSANTTSPFGISSFIGNGQRNNTIHNNAFIGCGDNNTAGGLGDDGQYSFIGNGLNNVASSDLSFIGNGNSNITPSTSPYPITIFGQANLPGPINGQERMFMIGNGNPFPLTRRNIFSVDILGNVYYTGSTNAMAPLADFGEWFQSYDDNQIPLYSTVTLLPNRKIKRCDVGETPIGVVSDTLAYIANCAEEEWIHKFERGPNGKIIYEEVEEVLKKPVYEEKEKVVVNKKLIEENGQKRYELVEETVVQKVPIYEKIPVYHKGEIRQYIEEIKFQDTINKVSRPKVNPNYNDKIEYVPRSARKEWHPVGLLGVVKINEGEVIDPKWIKLDDGFYFIK